MNYMAKTYTIKYRIRLSLIRLTLIIFVPVSLVLTLTVIVPFLSWIIAGKWDYFLDVIMGIYDSLLTKNKEKEKKEQKEIKKDFKVIKNRFSGALPIVITGTQKQKDDNYITVKELKDIKE